MGPWLMISWGAHEPLGMRPKWLKIIELLWIVKIVYVFLIYQYITWRKIPTNKGRNSNNTHPLEVMKYIVKHEFCRSNLDAQKIFQEQIRVGILWILATLWFCTIWKTTEMFNTTSLSVVLVLKTECVSHAGCSRAEMFSVNNNQSIINKLAKHTDNMNNCERWMK